MLILIEAGKKNKMVLQEKCTSMNSELHLKAKLPLAENLFHASEVSAVCPFHNVLLGYILGDLSKNSARPWFIIPGLDRCTQGLSSQDGGWFLHKPECQIYGSNKRRL